MVKYHWLNSDRESNECHWLNWPEVKDGKRRYCIANSGIIFIDEYDEEGEYFTVHAKSLEPNEVDAIHERIDKWEKNGRKWTWKDKFSSFTPDNTALELPAIEVCSRDEVIDKVRFVMFGNNKSRKVMPFTDYEILPNHFEQDSLKRILPEEIFLKLFPPPPPPPPSDTGYIGNMPNGSGVGVLFNSQVLRHVCIIGGSGSGKTVSAFVITEEALIHRIPVLALDPSGMFTGFMKPCDNDNMLSRYDQFGMRPPFDFVGSVYVPSSNVGLKMKSNLLAKPPTDDESELSAHADEVSSILKSFCDLSSNEKVEVRKKIFDSWKDGVSLDYQSIVDDEFKDVLKNKLESLVSIKYLFEGVEKVDFEDFMKEGEISVISLSEISNEDVEMFVSYFVLRQLVDYFDKQPDVEEIRFLLVVDECHRFKDVALDMLNRIVRTLRKKGVGCVFASQVMVDLSRDIRANTATKIYMKTLYDRDVERARQDLGEGADQLGSLPVGTGILAYQGNPKVVHFRPCYCSPKGMTLDEIRSKFNP